jgi:hypothetical protein
MHRSKTGVAVLDAFEQRSRDGTAECRQIENVRPAKQCAEPAARVRCRVKGKQFQGDLLLLRNGLAIVPSSVRGLSCIEHRRRRDLPDGTVALQQTDAYGWFGSGIGESYAIIYPANGLILGLQASARDGTDRSWR